MLDFAVKNGVRRFLFTSSGAIYGTQPSALQKISEVYNGAPDPLLHNNTYGIAKRQAEHLCTLYGQHYGVETITARCFAFVGPDLPLRAHFAIGNFISDALTGEALIVNGDGTPIRSYLDQRDLANWLFAMLRNGRPGEAYNVGSDQAISIYELAQTVSRLLAPGKQVRLMGKPQNDSLRSRYIPCTDKASKELGLQVSVSLEQAILFAASSHNKTETL
jgi:dTDP-glucose 4,6-dehydratase